MHGRVAWHRAASASSYLASMTACDDARLRLSLTASRGISVSRESILFKENRDKSKRQSRPSSRRPAGRISHRNRKRARLGARRNSITRHLSGNHSARHHRAICRRESAAEASRGAASHLGVRAKRLSSRHVSRKLKETIIIISIYKA